MQQINLPFYFPLNRWKSYFDVEVGIEHDAAVIGSLDDDNYYINNTGKGKRYHCGPQCTYKGIVIPCMCQWSKNGSITPDILKEICETLDSYNVFRRSTRRKPMMIINGHSSSVHYVNDPEHEWVVCIGVPDGTSYWQLGDSIEKNMF